MTKIGQLDRQTLKIVRAKMDEVLSVLEEEIGVHAEVGHISYQAQNATVKVEISVLGDGGEIVTKEATAYDDRREMHGLPERGATFSYMGETYKITGLKPRSRKYPVMVERADGKGFKFPIAIVKAAAA